MRGHAWEIQSSLACTTHRKMINYSILLLFFVLRTVDSVGTGTIDGNCMTGSYRSTSGPFNSCAGFITCEPGFYCSNFIKIPCPAGTFGSTFGLENASCTNSCMPGYFCPEQSTSPYNNPCGNITNYCPAGSSVPRVAPVGYYTTNVDGSNTDVTTRALITQCPKGHYCIGARKVPCPFGTYGESVGLSTSLCSGSCPEGWYCPPATVHPHQFACSKSPKNFCPQGSGHSLTTNSGYYASSPHVLEGGGFGSQTQCPPGSYCLEGIQYACAAGRYGSTPQMINSSCTGLCRGGYYCPEGSTRDMQHACGDHSVYCPEGSPQPIPVSPGYYSTGFQNSMENEIVGSYLDVHATSQLICEPGTYCTPDGRSCRVCIYV